MGELLLHQKTLYTSGNPTRRWLHISRRDWILSAIRRHLPESKRRAAEVGPGSGVYLPLMLELFEEVVAMDVEVQYLEAAKTLALQHPHLVVQQRDITNISDFDSIKCDLVLCTEVIEHIPPEKSDAAFEGLRAITADDGILVFSTPHRWSTLETVARVALSPALIPLSRLIYREPVLEMGHINLLTRSQVARSLSNAGFDVVEKYATGIYIPLISEFLGNTALRFEKWLEPRLRDSRFHQLLWTQMYVARPVTPL